MKLYWVTTKDHDEDWFIVASSPLEASKHHENMEGYNPGDAKAEEILDIPENVPAETGWPSDELLIAVGAKFLLNDQSRVVEIAGRRFCEAMLEATLNEINDDLFEKYGEERLNKTTIGKKMGVLLGVRFFDLNKEIESFFETSIERLQNRFLTMHSFRDEAAKALGQIRDVVD